MWIKSLASLTTIDTLGNMFTRITILFLDLYDFVLFLFSFVWRFIAVASQDIMESVHVYTTQFETVLLIFRSDINFLHEKFLIL